ncbi:MAG: nucleotidyltransferase family protein [Silvibacterium sp.]
MRSVLFVSRLQIIQAPQRIQIGGQQRWFCDTEGGRASTCADLETMKNSAAEMAASLKSGQKSSPDCATSWSPEFELLLCSARTVPDAARIQTLTAAGIDWHAFLELAAQHRVRPLVYKALRATCWERIPMDVQSEWEKINRTLTIGNLYLAGELLRITAEFEAAKIPIAAMKGAVIAAMAYGDLALREYEDLDLLIDESDFSRAVELLERLEYQPFWTYDNRKIVRFLRHVGEYTLISNTRRAGIDLHWRVATKATALSPRVSDFPSGFQPFPLAGATVLTFAPHDLPLYMAAQGGWDQWADLRRICDVAEFLRKFPDIDWEPTMRIAQRLGGLRSMLTGLSLASSLLGAEIPSSAIHRIHADKMVSRLAEESRQDLQRESSSGEATRRYLFQLNAKQGLRGKIALAYSILMDRTAHDGNWIMLPRPLWWLYGVLRPVRMGRKLLRRL